MATFQGVFRSAALGMDTHLSVVLPHDFEAPNLREPCPVLYLLHGLSQGSDAWLRRSNVERYCREYGVALVMPEVQRSFYLDLTYGPRYFTYVSGELPEICRRMFRLSPAREDTFVAGLSMGGYGALLCALSRPEQYAAAASFSGALDIRDVAANFTTDATAPEMMAAFGPALEVPPEADLFHLANLAAARSPCPRLLLTCGEQDDLLIGMSRRLDAHLDSLPIEHRLATWPGGHDWDFWDRSVVHALEFFFGGK